MSEDFDRGEIDRASLEATERLRARLAGRPANAAAGAGPRRPVLPWVLAGTLFVFLAGMIANPWFETSVRGRLPFAQEKGPQSGPDVDALTRRLDRLEQRAPAVAGERLAAAEARVETASAQIDRDAERLDRISADLAALTGRVAAQEARGATAAATAVTAAERAEAMLALVLARRALAEGRPLGSVEPVLRRLYEARYPMALKPVLALGAAPATRAQLGRELERLDGGSGGARRAGWWQALANRFDQLVTAPAGQEDFVARARAQLDKGNVAGAASAVRAQPASAARGRWLAMADRITAAEQGLATLETATLTAPATPPPQPVLTP